jgi:hypothetical protein
MNFALLGGKTGNWDTENRRPALIGDHGNEGQCDRGCKTQKGKGNGPQPPRNPLADNARLGDQIEELIAPVRHFYVYRPMLARCKLQARSSTIRLGPAVARALEHGLRIPNSATPNPSWLTSGPGFRNEPRSFLRRIGGRRGKDAIPA